MRRNWLKLFVVLLTIGNAFAEYKLIPVDGDLPGGEVIVLSDDVENDVENDKLVSSSNNTYESNEVRKEFEEDYAEDQDEQFNAEDDDEGDDNIGVWTFKTDNGETGVVDINNITDHVEAYDEKAPRNCPSCRCGVKYGRKIIGGTNILQYEFPWLVIIREFGKFVCAGSLISDQDVVTAAHCVPKRTRAYRVVLHVNNRFQPESTAVTRRVRRIFLHNYNGFNRDLAVLKLNNPVTLGLKIRPVCLPTTNSRTFIGVKAVTVGWGAMLYNKFPKFPKQVVLPIRRTSYCKKTASGKTLTRFETCAGYSYGGPGTCRGDGGDPLMVRRGARLMLVGVNSRRNCRLWSRGPTIFARVNQFLNFINRVTQNSCFCSG